MSEYSQLAEQAIEQLNEKKIQGTEGATEKAKILWIACCMLGSGTSGRSVCLSIEQIADLGKIDLQDAVRRVGQLEELRMVAIHSPDGDQIPSGIFGELVGASSEWEVLLTRGGEYLASRQLLVNLTTLGLDRALEECGWVGPLIREENGQS